MTKGNVNKLTNIEKYNQVFSKMSSGIPVFKKKNTHHQEANDIYSGLKTLNVF